MAFTVDRLGPGAIRLTLGDVFLAEDAWQVHELMERSEPGTRIELDFRRVRECADFALSLLARDVLGEKATFDLRGLTQHQERVLSYFGVDATQGRALLDFDPL